MHPILQRREVALDINVYVRCARINHRIPLVDRHCLTLKNVPSNRGLQNSQIDGLTLAHFIEIELLKTILEPLQAGKFSVEREPAVIADLTVVFVKAQGCALKRPRGEVALNEFLSDRFVFLIWRLQTDAVR